ncbi:MAG TPA: hypothetical protein VFQ90_11840 [Stellaceae bacterium]|nr:hypothetical protein [Stellaceae bacterium]
MLAGAAGLGTAADFASVAGAAARAAVVVTWRAMLAGAVGFGATTATLSDNVGFLAATTVFFATGFFAAAGFLLRVATLLGCFAVPVAGFFDA